MNWFLDLLLTCYLKVFYKITLESSDMEMFLWVCKHQLGSRYLQMNTNAANDKTKKQAFRRFKIYVLEHFLSVKLGYFVDSGQDIIYPED